MEELLNVTRRDNFLVYLQCWELCEAYGLPLTEDILMRGRGLLQGRALANVELALILATLYMHLTKPPWPWVGTLGRRRKKGRQHDCQESFLGHGLRGMGSLGEIWEIWVLKLCLHTCIPLPICALHMNTPLHVYETNSNHRENHHQNS